MKIVVGGQLGKAEIEKKVKELSKNEIEVEVKSDLDAAMAIKSNQADYYVGACETGSGGALAMAIAMLGSEATITLASPSKVLSPAEIEKSISEGKKAFGFTLNQANNVLNILIPALLKKN